MEASKTAGATRNSNVTTRHPLAPLFSFRNPATIDVSLLRYPLTPRVAPLSSDTIHPRRMETLEALFGRSTRAETLSKRAIVRGKSSQSSRNIFLERTLLEIHLGAEKRLETFSFQREGGRASSSSSSSRPVSFQRRKERRTRRWRSCLIVQRVRRATDATNRGAWEEKRRMDGSGHTRMDARGHGQKELGYL